MECVSAKWGCAGVKTVVGVWLWLVSAAVVGADTDIFLAHTGNPRQAPKVLFIVDTSYSGVAGGSGGASSERWEMTRAGLQQALDNLRPGSIKAGLMLYAPSSTGGAGRRETGLRREISLLDTTGLTGISAQLTELEPGAGFTSAETLALAFAAGFRRLGVATEPACEENYLVVLTHSPGVVSASTNIDAETRLAREGGNTSAIALNGDTYTEDLADEWARFMAESDLAVRSFVIDTSGAENSDWAELMKSVARVSGGEYFPARSAADVAFALQAIFNRPNVREATFTPPVLPAQSGQQARFHNQVFLGGFRPDELGRPRWVGNLKQYRLGLDVAGRPPVLIDAVGRPLIDPAHGGIDHCARSYWTPASADDYWEFWGNRKLGSICEETSASGSSNFPDGSVVEKGGHAYVLRGGGDFAGAIAAHRQVWTTSGSLCGGSTEVDCKLSEFSVENAATIASDLGVSDLGVSDISVSDSSVSESAQRQALINWARGADVLDEDGDGNTQEFRPSVHGDIIHSTPLAIDYANDPNAPRIAVFYGANDGMFRAINGNRASAHDGHSVGTGLEAGGEYWSFLPPEAFPLIQRRYANQNTVRMPSSGEAAPALGESHGYGPDGPVSTVVTADEQRYLYFGLRRGGRVVYGFDISDLNAPSLLWRLGCTTPEGGEPGCAPGWEGMGQSWSAMTPVRVAGTTSPYLLMGGGYAACEDVDDPGVPANHDCEGIEYGNRVYVLSSVTGDILATFDTERAVPGNVMVVSPPGADRNRISYAYVADTGGNLYRLSAADGAAITSETPDQWQLTRIASLGCDGTAVATCTAQRKFLYSPDVVRLPDGNRFALMIGSGDREKPIREYAGSATVKNYFYAVVDAPEVPGWLDGEVENCGEAVMCSASLASADLAAGGEVQAVTGKGWQLALQPKEQVVTGALTISGWVHFGTHIHEPLPAPGFCEARGTGIATRYKVSIFGNEGQREVVPGAGLLATPVAGNVELDDGTIEPLCIGCGGAGAPAGVGEIDVPLPAARSGNRIYWKVER